MSEIQHMVAREILDSRGNPTVEVEIYTTSGCRGRAAVPSGASTGSREALELRDKNPKRYFGKGVLNAIDHINQVLASALKGMNVSDQQKIDHKMIEIDGTENKSHMGANAILAISLACAKAAAAEEKMELYHYLGGSGPFIMPVPLMNIINGGCHADNGLDIQEFMIIPAGAPTFSEALRYGVEVFHTLKQLLQKRRLSTSVGDEGGFAPRLPSNRAAIDLIIEAIEKAGYTPGKEIYLGLDVASSEFYKQGHYYLRAERQHLTSEEFVNYLAELAKDYPIVSIEDGMAENNHEGWQLLTRRLGKNVQLVGDDLFVTNPTIFREGIKKRIANAILIKPNQIGTLTETITTIGLAKNHHYNFIISHRSGETEDTFIADLAVATAAGQIKTGSLCRSDRVAKYNQLLRIESELKDKAPYMGQQAFVNFI